VYVLGAIHEAVRPGPDRWLDDGLTMLRPWGFEPSDVRQPVAVWHSHEDTMVPVEHGRRLAAAIPAAEPFLVEGLGHGEVCNRQEAPMMDWIAAKAAAAGRARG
jgi:pimeloyl-ACP methyl ester carboxylesterase